MKYVHTETGEVWNGLSSTSRTSNFYLLSHGEKLALGWKQIVEPVIETSLEQKKVNKLGEVKREATLAILDKYPEHKQRNAALGIYAPEYINELKAYIIEVRKKVDDYEDLIEAGTLDFEVVF